MIDKINLSISGTVTLPDGKKVYQRVRAGLGNISNGGRWDVQERAHVIPTDPRTHAQLQRRQAMRDANSAWQAMSPAERATWDSPAQERQITAYNAFISYYLRS